MTTRTRFLLPHVLGRPHGGAPTESKKVSFSYGGNVQFRLNETRPWATNCLLCKRGVAPTETRSVRTVTGIT